MKNSRYLLLAGVIATAMALSGCGGGGGGGDGGGSAAGPATSVPDSAGASVSAFIAFLLSLDPNDETSEPLAISDNFAVPDDDVNDPTPIS